MKNLSYLLIATLIGFNFAFAEMYTTSMPLAPVSPDARTCKIKILSSSLKIGGRGNDVKILQDFLISRGYLNGSSTSYFGNGTRLAVMKYQRENGIVQTGTFGPLTKKNIEGKLCADVLGSLSTSTATYTQTFMPGITTIILDPTKASTTTVPVNSAPVSSNVPMLNVNFYQTGAQNDKLSAVSEYNISNYRNGLVLDVAMSLDCPQRYGYMVDCSQYSFNLNNNNSTIFTGVKADPYVAGGASYRFNSAAGKINIDSFLPEMGANTNNLVRVPDSITYVFKLIDTNTGQELQVEKRTLGLNN
jgi:peptidoglycan hydrolase-like protein with peptidoglycan-binding domain